MRRGIATLIVAAAAAAGAAGTAQADGREVRVEITNLTNAVYFTPLLVSAHRRDFRFFEPGEPASASLQAMAEGGDVSGLAADVEAAGGRNVVDPAGGLLGPGETAVAEIEARGRNRYLSLAAMLLPTNDGFVALNGIRIPRGHHRKVVYLLGYDAGTEANDEVITGGGAPGAPGIPADPGGNAGTGGTGAAGPDHNPTVHVHRGVLGDDDPAGGPSDLDAAVHRWMNPVARVVIWRD